MKDLDQFAANLRTGKMAPHIAREKAGVNTKTSPALRALRNHLGQDAFRVIMRMHVTPYRQAEAYAEVVGHVESEAEIEAHLEQVKQALRRRLV